MKELAPYLYIYCQNSELVDKAVSEMMGPLLDSGEVVKLDNRRGRVSFTSTCLCLSDPKVRLHELELQGRKKLGHCLPSLPCQGLIPPPPHPYPLRRKALVFFENSFIYTEDAKLNNKVRESEPHLHVFVPD